MIAAAAAKWPSVRKREEGDDNTTKRCLDQPEGKADDKSVENEKKFFYTRLVEAAKKGKRGVGGGRWQKIHME